MPYPGEISSTAKTVDGINYHEVEVYPFGVTDKMLMLVPDSIDPGDSVTVVIAAHGSGGTEQTVNSANMLGTRNAWLARGWIVLSAFAHDRAWANNNALDDYVRVHTYAAAQWTVTDVFFHGQSMGGLTLALLYAQQRVPNVRAVAIVDGAVNLDAAWNHPTHRGHIRAAYGIAADGSDYAAKTAGHNPCNIAPSLFDDSWLYLWASPDDTSVPKATHADVFEAHVAGYPDEITVQTVSGAHVSASHYQPATLMAFYDRAVGIDPSDALPLRTVRAQYVWNGAYWAASTVYLYQNDWVEAPA